MALPVQQFPWQTWADIDAFGSGYMRAKTMEQMATANQYQQPLLQQQLQKATLDNQILQPQAEFARPNEQANLSYNQTRAPLNNAQIADIYQGRIPMQQAQAGLAGAQAGLARADTQNAINYPLKDEMNGALSRYQVLAQQYGEGSPQAQQARGVVEVMANKAQAQAAYYGANTDLKNMPVGARYDMVANGYTPTTTSSNPVNIFGGGAQQAQQGQQQQQGGAAQPAWMPQPSQVQQSGMPAQGMPSSANQGAPNLQRYLSQQAAGGQQPQQSQFSMVPLAAQIQQMQANPGTPTTAQDIAAQNQIAGASTPQSRDVAKSYVIKGTETAAQQNQTLYGETFNALTKMADPLMPSVVKFAGLAGQAGKKMDQFVTGAGITADNNPDYANYLKFTRTVAPAMANEFKRMLGGQATDQETKIMDNLTNSAYWDSNPQIAMEQYNLMKDVGRTQSGVLGETPSQLKENAREQGSQSSDTAQQNSSAPKIDQKDLTDANISATAQKYNMTEAEVRQRLGVK